ncbi:hypothetical protein SAMN05216376_11234 [Mameliella alba]|nr:hypothetical protein [Mameliella alba]OWV46151.1 hypothetical protein CDZ96_19915 [Mameliella alba]PTR37003.1 hypothetical protein LX94_03795 [Mameliella alba]GGF77015.1 hypothetical protein GCM10011319_41700 [Mameliella alba]SDD81711.1 hypothetical protein SAMN05216376_11234 [Mameliella alba]
MTSVQEGFRTIYGPNQIGPENKAYQIANLAKAGLAASDSLVNLQDVPGTLGSVFEVIAQLCEELARDVE